MDKPHPTRHTLHQITATEVNNYSMHMQLGSCSLLEGEREREKERKRKRERERRRGRGKMKAQQWDLRT